jgi:hypothetical protein
MRSKPTQLDLRRWPDALIYSLKPEPGKEKPGRVGSANRARLRKTKGTNPLHLHRASPALSLPRKNHAPRAGVHSQSRPGETGGRRLTEGHRRVRAIFHSPRRGPPRPGHASGRRMRRANALSRLRGVLLPAWVAHLRARNNRRSNLVEPPSPTAS